MTRTRHLILWIKQGDPPSERAKVTAEGWRKIVPANLGVQVRTVSTEEPEVSRVPCLNFMLEDEVVYSIEGDITLDAVLRALRRLG